MNEYLLATAIGAGGAVLGAGVAGFAAYKAALVGFNARRMKADLAAALKDILAFRSLEEVLRDRRPPG